MKFKLHYSLLHHSLPLYILFQLREMVNKKINNGGMIIIMDI